MFSNETSTSVKDGSDLRCSGRDVSLHIITYTRKVQNMKTEIIACCIVQIRAGDNSQNVKYNQMSCYEC